MGFRNSPTATLAVHGRITHVAEYTSLADAVQAAGEHAAGQLITVRDHRGILVYATDGNRSWSPGESPATVAEWGIREVRA